MEVSHLTVHNNLIRDKKNHLITGNVPHVKFNEPENSEVNNRNKIAIKA